MPQVWQVELAHAVKFRQDDRDGRARVCAYRAASAAAREYLLRCQKVLPTINAYDALHLLTTSPSLIPDLHVRISHRMMQIDKSFQLPPEVDLLADDFLLCERLSAEEGNHHQPLAKRT